MHKVNFYIDGLNIYHRIRDYDERTKKNYRWLDYSLLFPKLLKDSAQCLPEIGDIHMFISYPNIPEKKANLRILTRAWESRGLKIIYGKFSHFNEEKQTDVNIALEMYEHAILKNCKHLYLVTSDSDLIPALKKIEGIEGVKAGLITPPFESGVIKRQRITGLTKHASLKTINWKFNHCHGCSLPETFKLKGKDYFMPKGYETF